MFFKDLWNCCPLLRRVSFDQDGLGGAVFKTHDFSLLKGAYHRQRPRTYLIAHRRHHESLATLIAASSRLQLPGRLPRLRACTRHPADGGFEGIVLTGPDSN